MWVYNGPWGCLSETVLGHRLEGVSGSSISDIWFGEMLDRGNGKRCLHEFPVAAVK